MAESLIDFGQIANNLQGFERNRIYEQNSLQQAEQNRLQGIQLKQQAEHSQLGGLLKLADDSTISANPAKKNQVLTAAWKLAGLPDVNPVDFQRGLDARQEHLQGLLAGDPAKAADAFVKIAASASPTELKQLTETAKDFHTLRDRVENVNAMQLVNKARFEKLHDSQAKVKIGLFPYAQGVRDFTAALDGTDRKDFMTSMLMYGKLGPEKGKSLPIPQQAAETAKNANALAERYSQIADRATGQLRLLEDGEPLPRGVEKRDLIEQVEVGTRMAQSYDTLGQWALNPYDKTALKAARDAHGTIVQYRKDLDKLDASNKSESSAVARDSLTFRQGEAGIKHFSEQRIQQASAESLKRFGYAPTAEQLANVATKFNVAPKDIVVGDPAKKGTLSAVIKLGQEDVSRNLKLIDASQGVLDLVGELRDRVKANPAIVGKGAQFGTAFAGSAQQLRAISQLDPAGAKFLNTKTRDEAESLHEILVYLQARSMDPSGVLDVNVVKHARTVLGDMSSLTTGPTQLLNKLEQVSVNAERNIRRARRNLSGGIGAALNDVPTDKPITEQSEEELMNIILQGSQ